MSVTPSPHTSAAGDTPVVTTAGWVISPTTFYLYVITLITLAYYLYKQATQETWTQYGIKEPKLPLLFGFGDDFRSKFSQLLNQYGDMVGMKVRSNLVLLTSNLNLMRHVLVKDFNNFVERAESLRSNSPLTKSLFFAKQNEWKRNRQIVSPTFSSGKLKHIARSVDNSAEDLASFLEKCARNNQLVPIKDIAAQYTGEIIAKTAFGLNVNFIGKEDSEFLHYARTMLSPILGMRAVIFRLLNFIPQGINICLSLFPKIQFFDPISIVGTEYFKQTLTETIAERRKLHKEGVQRRHVDFLDLILKANDAAKEGKLEINEDEDNEEDKTKQDWNTVVRALTNDEVLGHSLLIIFAGMETTATTLQLSLYQLALNPHYQEQAYQEIVSTVKSATPTTEELSSLHYVEQVINETLRLHPPVPLVDRKAMETRTYDGVTIPKDARIVIPFFHIMTDPKFYPNPLEFNPDRFSPEQMKKRDPMAFLPFGQGPRQCLGMRLAYLELKLALVHVLRKLKVVVNDNTVPRKGEKLKFTPQGLLTPVKPVMLAFELRENGEL